MLSQTQSTIDGAAMAAASMTPSTNDSIQQFTQPQLVSNVQPSTSAFASYSSQSSTTSSSSSSSLSSSSSISKPWDVFIHRRSRSNSPNNAPFLVDLSYLDLNECDEELSDVIAKRSPYKITEILLNNNLLQSSPLLLSAFVNLETLDLSSNCLKYLDADICSLVNLRVFIAKENELTDISLPKDLADKLTQLELINLSGNQFTQFPYQLLECRSLREIYLGSNKIGILPRSYEQLVNLEVLYLGGNQIKCVPEEFCQLKQLSSLNLSNNLISSLPTSLARLKNMTSLYLQGNNLTTLPVELVKLNIKELSLRNNPLVKRFARDFVYDVPSLLELSGRVVVKRKHLQPYNTKNLPKQLIDYLNSAQCCLNPKCKGVYFTSKVEHIKFVDFCGKFRVPLMQYLCSSTCNEKISSHRYSESASSSSSSDSDDQIEDKLLKKILIG